MKRPKRTWRIVIHGVGAAVVTARWFGEAARRAARMLTRTLTCKVTGATRIVPHKLITDHETGGWVGVSGAPLDLPF